jgi:hypothetical protein
MRRSYSTVLALALVVSISSVAGVSSANAAAGTITSGGCSAAVGEVSTATISQVGSDCVIKFTSGSNSWTVPAGVTSVRYLVVAGGGAGGAAGYVDGSGGGGAGGVLAGTFSVGASSYSVSVGAGGASTSSGAGSHNPASFNGINSFISGTALTTITAIGGGSASSESGFSRVAQNGGSGGGGGGYSGSRGTGTAGPPRQGYDGGATSAPGDGGGGGAGAPGGNGNSSNGVTPARAGGVGVTNDITGTTTYYGGGGGASGDPRSGLSAGGAGGLGGGGTGANASSESAPTNGAVNTGGGGGGAAGTSQVGSVKPTGAGGSGVVIIRYFGDATAPTITGPSSATGATSSISIQENSTAVHTFTANESVTWSVSGTDSSFFAISSGGVLTITARNFESPADSGTNNTYEVTITATDLGNNVKTQALTVTITNLNEAPTLTNNSSSATYALSQAENITSVVTYAATDVDAGASLSFSITSGSDSADFTINSATGVLAFVTSPDFEAPIDSDLNNTYVVVITVSDGSLTDAQTLTVTITNANETAALNAPTVSGSIYKGTQITITVTSSAAGKVRFFVGGKRISGCLAKSTSGSYPTNTATCAWKPPVTGRQILTAQITPTDNTFSASTSAGTEVRVLKRVASR